MKYKIQKLDYYKQNNPNFKGGKPKCIDCGKELSTRGTKSYRPERCIKCKGKITGQKIKGKNNFQYKNGKTLKKCYCIDCAKKIHYKSIRCKSCARKGKFNNHYIDGRTPTIKKIRNSKKYIIWRNKIFKRDKYICQLCGKKGNLNAHHKIPLKDIVMLYTIKSLKQALKNKLLWDINWGITVCYDCHIDLDFCYKGKNNEYINKRG